MTTSAKRPDLLAQTEIGATAATATREQLAAAAHRIDAPRGRFLVDAGQPSAPVHFVISGAIQLAVPNITGNEKTIATLGAGKAFGLAESFGGRAYDYYARAYRASVILTVPGRALLNAAEQDPALMRAMLGSLSRHFGALIEDIANSNRYNAHQRVVNLLLARARSGDGGTVEAELPYPKSVTASRLGLAPETFSRSLANLSERGLISVHNRLIALHDPGALQAMLDSE